MTIGIDPGTATVGFSLVNGTKSKPVIVEYGILQTAARPREFMPERLAEIAADLESLIIKYKPDTAVVEDLFFFKNAKTVISVAQARGVILYLLAKHGVKIQEYTPLQIKMAVCGYGRATKIQLQEMVKKIYKLEQIPKPDDAADSLAMAWLGLPNS
jgi:crossover junction endodeoxyribonuclease RuvC